MDMIIATSTADNLIEGVPPPADGRLPLLPPVRHHGGGGSEVTQRDRVEQEKLRVEGGAGVLSAPPGSSSSPGLKHLHLPPGALSLEPGGKGEGLGATGREESESERLMKSLREKDGGLSEALSFLSGRQNLALQALLDLQLLLVAHGVDLLGECRPLLVAHRKLALLLQLPLGLSVLPQVALRSHQEDGHVGAVVRHLRRQEVRDGEADDEDVGLRVGERPQPVVLLLARRVPQVQTHHAPVHRHLNAPQITDTIIRASYRHGSLGGGGGGPSI
ncbi:hypothetical protein F7725_006345 [Dissostichus mawsoni]|uniref:Uncharacterized protein n=1 Tax=Dissostichus mawsoni TaxID=36200 RepID=A0A7J5XTR4_DISMA|nr:hypothetical protein F7725_006345 [Dissostichus mawsoni]